jgi:hypothetical protein
LGVVLHPLLPTVCLPKTYRKLTVFLPSVFLGVVLHPLLPTVCLPKTYRKLTVFLPSVFLGVVFDPLLPTVFLPFFYRQYFWVWCLTLYYRLFVYRFFTVSETVGNYTHYTTHTAHI